MADHQSKYQPGPVFHEVFLGGLKAMGVSTRDFVAEHNLHLGTLRAISCGLGNGRRSQDHRNVMIEAVGVDVFDFLYRERMKREVAKLEAAE